MGKLTGFSMDPPSIGLFGQYVTFYDLRDIGLLIVLAPSGLVPHFGHTLLGNRVKYVSLGSEVQRNAKAVKRAAFLKFVVG